MTTRQVLVDVLVPAGVLIEVMCALGVALMPGVFVRLHYLSGASTLGPGLIAAAVLIAKGASVFSIKAFLVAALLLLSGPPLTHALARASLPVSGPRAAPRPADETAAR